MFEKLTKDFLAQEISVADFTAFSIEKEQLVDILNYLKSSTELRFTILNDLFAADFPERKQRFEVVYSLLSLKLNKRILLKLSIAEHENVKSVADIFSSACWYEREVYDMFGIRFSDSPDLRRILTDYGFVGHPLRKDFPVTGFVQVRYDENIKQVINEPVVLDQEFRNFDFISPWKGPEKVVLPGDEKATK